MLKLFTEPPSYENWEDDNLMKERDRLYEEISKGVSKFEAQHSSLWESMRYYKEISWERDRYYVETSQHSKIRAQSNSLYEKHNNEMKLLHCKIDLINRILVDRGTRDYPELSDWRRANGYTYSK